MHDFRYEELPGLEEGFTKENDTFSRKELGSNLTRLVVWSKKPLTLAIDGEWGIGKSYFVRQWIGELKKEKFPVVYFDALKSDYVVDPFMPLVSAILAEFREAKGTKNDNSEKWKELAKKTKTFAQGLAVVSAKVAVRAVTAGIVTGDEIKEGEVEEYLSAGGADKELGDFAGKLVERQLDALIEEKSVNEDFQRSLTSFARYVGTSEKPLMIVIDELDRCRPDYALALLERVKHLFTGEHVDNVVVVLVSNMKQLQYSVKKRYGEGVDARAYLQKFYDRAIPLNHSTNTNRSSIDAYLIKHLANSLSDLQLDHQDLNIIKNTISQLITNNGRGIRDIQKMLGMMCVNGHGLHSFRVPHLVDDEPVVVCVSVYMYLFEPDLFADFFFTRMLDWKEYESRLRFDGARGSKEGEVGSQFLYWLTKPGESHASMWIENQKNTYSQSGRNESHFKYVRSSLLKFFGTVG
ncbi:KAP family P-loop NTPase fold protein [Ferrimonas sp.]|uniref:KAP family P-loop NTPase fold protein n=1 Tax=Ferrimonas sp. TaxID=2080861 RepID=UPI003A8F1E6C